MAWCVERGDRTFGHWPGHAATPLRASRHKHFNNQQLVWHRPGHKHTISLRVSRHKHLILFSLKMPVLTCTLCNDMWVSVQSAHLTYMTINLSFNTDDHSCLLLEGHHISNIQYSRRHKNVMNVMWRSCKSLGWLDTGNIGLGRIQRRDVIC